MTNQETKNAHAVALDDDELDQIDGGGANLTAAPEDGEAQDKRPAKKLHSKTLQFIMS